MLSKHNWYEKNIFKKMVVQPWVSSTIVVKPQYNFHCNHSKKTSHKVSIAAWQYLINWRSLIGWKAKSFVMYIFKVLRISARVIANDYVSKPTLTNASTLLPLQNTSISVSCWHRKKHRYENGFLLKIMTKKIDEVIKQ